MTARRAAAGGGRLPRWPAWLVVLAIGCAGRAHPRGAGDGDAPADARITLYRDGALVEEIHRVTVDADGAALVPIAGDVATSPELIVGSPDAEVVEWTRIPGDVTGADVVVRTGDHEVAGRALGPRGAVHVIQAADGIHLIAGELVQGGRDAMLRVVTRGAGATATIELRYPTAGLRWHTTYTLVEERPGRGRLHGAIALDNQTGRRWERARFALVDRDRPAAIPSGLVDERFLIRIPGRFAVVPGEQHLDLGLPATPVPLRATLVYDPVGPSLDGGGMVPVSDPGYGVQRWPGRLDESILVDVSPVSRDPLPAGSVRLFAVGPDGALVLRGLGRFLAAADDAERYTAIAIGQAADVTGRRTRTLFERDEDRSRMVEEITLRFTSTRSRPVELLAREHLYRGKCWVLAYHSTGPRIAKEGEQQVGLGVTVPARGTATIVYRVVYLWDTAQCTPSKSPP